ncbi:MAG: hypothetical protein WCJ03_13270 [Bacteroidales bacterium]
MALQKNARKSATKPKEISKAYAGKCAKVVERYVLQEAKKSAKKSAKKGAAFAKSTTRKGVLAASRLAKKGYHKFSIEFNKFMTEK